MLSCLESRMGAMADVPVRASASRAQNTCSIQQYSAHRHTYVGSSIICWSGTGVANRWLAITRSPRDSHVPPTLMRVISLFFFRVVHGCVTSSEKEKQEQKQRLGNLSILNGLNCYPETWATPNFDAGGLRGARPALVPTYVPSRRRTEYLSWSLFY